MPRMKDKTDGNMFWKCYRYFCYIMVC